MNRIILGLFCLFFLQPLFGQDLFPMKKKRGGIFSLAARSTVSFFTESKPGTGAGGMFRLQLDNRVNTEWFLDYITTDIGGLAHRRDYHIGWSVMLYPWISKNVEKFEPVLPYLLAGHCFDWTTVVENANPLNMGKRFSSAIQAGAGVHFHLTQRLDITMGLQYMIHLGRDIHADIENNEVIIEKSPKGRVEGHFLGTIQVGYRIVDIW